MIEQSAMYPLHFTQIKASYSHVPAFFGLLRYIYHVVLNRLSQIILIIEIHSLIVGSGLVYKCN
jgi:hypothetical protein